VRIAGYVRETSGRAQRDTAFAQSERIRRWALDSGNDLIALCQDHHGAASAADRPGYRALVEIIRSGGADAVVIASLDALSLDKMTQEIMITDLRIGGATVISTDERDLELLRDGADDHARLVVRDVVHRLAEYRDAFGLSGDPVGTVPAQDVEGSTDVDYTDVVVELIAPTG
jgi:DNA invertase Pin-like site-specific DNA recombinase